MKRTQAMIAALLTAALLTGCGLTASRSNEGFADLDSLGMTDVDNKITLSIGPTLLGFAARHVEDDPETQELLRGLDGVRVRVYEIDRNPERVAGRIEHMSQKLREDDWQPIALIREEGETSHMLIKMSGGRICGLTVLVSDHHEAVVVNVMGDLRPEFFSDTMAALDVDTPDVQVASAEGGKDEVIEEVGPEVTRVVAKDVGAIP